MTDAENLPHRAEVIDLVKQAMVAADEQEFDAARQGFESALSVMQSNDDQQGIADLHFQWGDTFLEAKQVEVAEQQYALAITVYRSLGDKEMLAQVRFAQGQLKLEAGDAYEARKLFVAAEIAFGKIDDAEGIAFSHFYLGKSLHQVGEYEAALENYQAAFEEFRAVDDEDNARQVAEHLVATFDKVGNKTEADKIRAALAGHVLPQEQNDSAPHEMGGMEFLKGLGGKGLGGATRL